MTLAILRKIRADFKANKLQLGLIGVVLTLSAMLLFLSFLILTSTQDPWDRTFEETNGPHLWVVSHQYDLDFTPLTKDPLVVEHSGVIYSLAENPILIGDEKQNVYLYGMDEVPAVASPLLAEGRWLDSSKTGEVVLDFSLAHFFDFQAGDEITVLAAEGTLKLKVVGLAVTAHWFPYNEITKDVSPGVAYITRSTLEMLQPDPTHWYSVIGLRIKDPNDSTEFGNYVHEVFPGKLQTVLDWQYVKENATLASTLNGMFMGLFSIMGLIAVGLIIFNTISGQVLNQYRDIGLLKAIGFKPQHVTVIFLGEHLVIGLLASAVGVALGLLLAPNLVNNLAENLNASPPDIYKPGPIFLVLVLVEITVGLSTLIPAWQGGRINSVQAITVGYRRQHWHSSRMAKLSSWLHLPPVITVGVKDTFSRPVRSVFAIFSLLLTILVAMTAIGALSTVDYLASNRMYFNGSSADMKVDRNFLPPSLIEEEILSRPEVVDYYQESFHFGQTPGRSDQPIGIRLLGGNFDNFEFLIKEGRMISSPGEAVMGYAVLELLNANVGDTVEIQVEGNPIIVNIVGRHIENFNLNKVIITSFETYQTQVKSDVRPQTYYLKIDDYTNADSLRKEWLDQSKGLINVSIITDQPLASMVQLVNLIVSISVILMVVAGVNLMSNSLLSIQERVRDFGILKSIGLTPNQIVWSVLVAAVMIVIFALLIGYTFGLRLMMGFVSQVGIQIGAGPDFYRIDWGEMAILLPALIILAVTSSLLPAIRASKLDVVKALQYE